MCVRACEFVHFPSCVAFPGLYRASNLRRVSFIAPTPRITTTPSPLLQVSDAAEGQDTFHTPLATVPSEGGSDETAGESLVNATAATTEPAAAGVLQQGSDDPDTVAAGDMADEKAPSPLGTVAEPLASLDASGGGDDEVPAPPAEQSLVHQAGTDGQQLPGAAAPTVDEESALEKRKHSCGLSPPKLGRDKKPRSDAAQSDESANPADGNEDGAIDQSVATAAAEEPPAGDDQGAVKQLFSSSAAAEDAQAGPEGEAVVGGNNPAVLGEGVLTPAEGEQLPPSAGDSAPVAVMGASTEDNPPPPIVGAAVSPEVGEAAATVEPNPKEIAEPVPACGNEASDATIKEEQDSALEVAGVDERTAVAATATSVPATTTVGGDKPAPKKKQHQRGFSIPRLFGWDKKDKPRAGATTAEKEKAPATASEEPSSKPLGADGPVAASGTVPAAVAVVPVGAEEGAAEVPSTSTLVSAVETTENPAAAAVAAAPVDGSAEVVTPAMTVGVSDAIETAADEQLVTTDHAEEAPLAAAGAGEVERPLSGEVGFVAMKVKLERTGERFLF